MRSKHPSICGLVLAGGHSVRMGTDKARIIYHQQPQAIHVAELLKVHCADVYISRRQDQDNAFIPEQYGIIYDLEPSLGPVAALMAAHTLLPKSSWWIVACDMPLLTSEALQVMADKHSDWITVFQNDGIINPLFSIWESEALACLKQQAAQYQHSPRRFIEHHRARATIMDVAKPEWLQNHNLPSRDSRSSRMAGHSDLMTLK